MFSHLSSPRCKLLPAGLQKAGSDASYLRKQLSEFDLSALRMKQQETRYNLQSATATNSRFIP